jgi:hypothetical protein
MGIYMCILRIKSKYVMKKAKNCACVIHGTAYDWIYVERLYNMLKANLSHEIRMHVFTEPARPVPAPYIKHELQEWPGISGPKKSWWYKMQMFNSKHFAGRMLYLDLDTVITKNLDWMWELPDRHFWAIKDFKYLWRPSWQGLNSSVMLWDTERYHWIWQDFLTKNINATVKLHHGDQDYLTSVLDPKDLRFFDVNTIKSWRWQCKDGGYNMAKRGYNRPDTGTTVDPATAIMVFHGKPKPHEIHDSVVERYWITDK